MEDLEGIQKSISKTYFSDTQNIKERWNFSYSCAVDKQGPTKASSSCSAHSNSWSPAPVSSGTSSRCSDLQLAAVLIDLETNRFPFLQLFQTPSKFCISWLHLFLCKHLEWFHFYCVECDTEPQCEASQGLLYFLYTHTHTWNNWGEDVSLPECNMVINTKQTTSLIAEINPQGNKHHCLKVCNSHPVQPQCLVPVWSYPVPPLANIIVS